MPYTQTLRGFLLVVIVLARVSKGIFLWSQAERHFDWVVNETHVCRKSRISGAPYPEMLFKPKVKNDIFGMGYTDFVTKAVKGTQRLRVYFRLLLKNQCFF